MQHDEFLLILERSRDDALPFSAEYQAELRLFLSKVHAARQISFAMDSVTGGGGAIGEFIFNHTEALISAISVSGVAWLRGRFGRKLKLKFRDVEIEANTLEEVEAMAKIVHTLQEL